MTLQIVSFNVWAVIVCFFSNMVIGALWYSPLMFGNVWLRLIGKTQDDISKEDAAKSMMLSMIPAALMILLLEITLGFAGASSIVDALIIGSIVSVGFIGMSYMNLVLFEDRSMKLTLVNVGYMAVSLNIAAILLTLWA
ncbi:DUF1761 domain-containing protein [Candidatus Latescibacterota bacterium]